MAAAPGSKLGEFTSKLVIAIVSYEQTNGCSGRQPDDWTGWRTDMGGWTDGYGRIDWRIRVDWCTYPLTSWFPIHFAEKLTQTKKYTAWMASGDLYALPASAVPGCGFLLGMLLKQEGITRANQLYDIYKKQKKNFPKYLACKFGPWNLVYANTGA